MEEFNKLMEENNLPSVDALQYNVIKTASKKEEKKKSKKDTKMRTVNMRISLINVLKEDYAPLNLKAGETVTYTDEDIQRILDDWCKTKKGLIYYYIIHDVETSTPHAHIVLEFTNKNSSVNFSTVKNKFPWGNIDSCKYSVKSCVMYLIHKNHPQKHQYDPDKIRTNNRTKLESYLTATPYTLEVKTNWTVDQIIAGKIREFEIHKIDKDVYVKRNSKIKNAFDYRRKLIINNPNRSVQIIVIQGPPRIGKGILCKAYAKKNNKSICFSSASNDAWHDYGGQDIFVYDDFDYHKISITDFTKVIDNHNQTSVGARYRNRVFLGDTIFICTNIPIIQWFLSEDEEIRKPIFDRISYVIDFQDYKKKFNSDIVPKNTPNRELILKYEMEKFDKRFALQDGVARYTVNKIAYLEDIQDADMRKYAKDNLDNCCGRFLLAQGETNELFSGPTYHYFDLKKYVDLESDHEKATQIITDITTL